MAKPEEILPRKQQQDRQPQLTNERLTQLVDVLHFAIAERLTSCRSFSSHSCDHKTTRSNRPDELPQAESVIFDVSLLGSWMGLEKPRREWTLLFDQAAEGVEFCMPVTAAATELVHDEERKGPSFS